MRVQKKAPVKPSTVFLGESLMSGVLPQIMPEEESQIRHQWHTERGYKVRTADVGPDVVADDERGREEEPDHTLETLSVLL